ncbi:uncharacterized protein AC631_05523 [Debaryomyces fabryi]|uniref:Amino acid permease/ SLC12A domain-containing protein n=1 Tax=Debaryomyces fabryi TaxID=58627 RepID=A0A0V1PR54_9ASCO|nr:uncharacterized protein AC631_05523 [Debaryomyces fabryi]KRZ98717.1 hypothetical protein AC631_05523 [Debaryomyces fabryi]
MNTTKSHIHSVTSHGLQGIRSRAGEHLNQIVSNRSEIRVINQDEVVDEGDLLAQIGYKQELNRSYNSLQVFGIAFSIMGLLPSIASTLATGLEVGPVGLTWGWLISGLFILCIGALMSILSSLIPTSGGLYYWTNYYAPDLIRTPLSFMIGCSNSLALCGGICLINYGFAIELLSAIYINKDGNFDITNARVYGVFAACVVSHIILCCATTKHTATLQTFSIFINVFIIVLFFIAVPVGVSKNYEFNSAKFIFTEIKNFRTWDQGWSFMLSWMPAIW